MATNVTGSSARLFDWQMVHYIVHGGPNDPTKPTSTTTTITNPANTDGGYLSALVSTSTGTATNFITVFPIPGSQTPPAQPLPRSQMMFGGSGAGSAPAAGLTSVTNNFGGVYLGTVPQGAWVDSVDMFVYIGFTGGTQILASIGVYYCQANAYNTNTTGYVPSTMYPIAFLSGGCAANTLYSTETGLATAFTSNNTQNLGPGIGSTTFTAGSLASMSDIDLYFIAYGTASTSLTTGSAAVRIKFTGLEG